ncbi:hypothetical protein O4J55_23950, partial [Paracoccus sp. PXZ]
MQFQVAGVAVVLAPVIGAKAGGGDRMLEQHQQRVQHHLGSEQIGDMAQEQAGRGQGQGLAGGIVGDDAPAVQRRLHAAGQHPVGGDQRYRAVTLHRLADDQRHGLGLLAGLLGLDQGQGLGGGNQRAKARAFLDPLVGDRRRPQRQRDQPVAGRVGGGVRHPFRWCAELGQQRRIARLRVILGTDVEPIPDRLRQVRIEAGQHHRAHRQPGDGAHEIPRRAMRAGRAGDHHRA